jgi:lipoprotein NlpI
MTKTFIRAALFLMAGCWLGTANAELSDDGRSCVEGNGKPEETIVACSRFVAGEILPEAQLATAYNRRGMAYFRNHEISQAIADFDNAIRLSPQYASAYNNRGIVLQDQGDVIRALEDFDAAIRLNPKYAFALANRGVARLAKGDADAAIEDFDAALALNLPRSELVLTGRGKARMAKGDFDRAIADFDAALKVNAKYANALGGRAYARFCQGRFDAAAADFSLERELRPDSEASIGLFLAQARGGHDAKAALAESVKDVDPQQGLPSGVALFLGRITPEQVLQSVSDKDPKTQRDRTCKANFHVGEWYLLNGQTDLARAHLAKATQLCDKSFAEFAAARAELGRLK